MGGPPVPPLGKTLVQGKHCLENSLQVNFAVIATRQESSTTFYATLGEAML